MLKVFHTEWAFSSLLHTVGLRLLRPSTMQALTANARVEIPLVFPDSHPMLGDLASTQN